MQNSEQVAVDESQEKSPRISRRQRRFLTVFLAVVLLAAAVVLVAQLFTGCWIDVGNEMGDQPSVGYVEPPRSSAPDDAVPFQGPDVPVAPDVPVNPVSRTVGSQERGAEHYVIFCSLCHGEAASGAAPGPVGELFEPPPPNLYDRVGSLQDGEVFLAVSTGFGRMPALASRMSSDERWNIVNYLRGLVAGVSGPELDSAVLRGAAVYLSQCAECHGRRGEGGLGPPLYPSSLLGQSSTAEIAALVYAGRTSLGMPAFGDKLSEGQLNDVALLLQALQTTGPDLLADAVRRLATTTTTAPSAQTTTTTTTTTTPSSTTTTTSGGIPPDQELLGTKVFSDNCVGCHGLEGSGGIGPRLKPSDFVSSSSDAQVRDVIDNGRAGTAMPAWSGRLSSEETDAVVALLRSWQGPSSSGMTELGPTEEIPFTHRAHNARGVSCMFCHSGTLRAPAADLPPLELCAGCHRWLSTQTEQTQAVVAAFDDGKTVSWPRVYNLPDFVFFSHQPHVAVAKVSCTVCHGDVGDMTLAKKAKRLTMGFCLDCHKTQEDEARLIDCQICHQ
jgi:mono/diheme cytochrome c family protein